MENYVFEETKPKNMTATYFRINLTAFILLWLAAMDYILYLDAIQLWVILVCIFWGFVQGGIKETIALVRLLVAFCLALYGYHFLYNTSDFNFGAKEPVLVEVGWFLSALLLLWIILRVGAISLDKRAGKAAISPVVAAWSGAVISAAKGVLLIYIVTLSIFLTGLPSKNAFLGTQYWLSYTYRVTKRIEQLVPIFFYLDQKGLINRAHKLHEQNCVHHAMVTLFPEDTISQQKGTEFLQWLAHEPGYIYKLTQSSEAQRMIKEFSQIPQAKKWLESSPDIMLWKHEDSSIFLICQLLVRPAVVELASLASIKELANSANFNKLKADIAK